MASDSVNSKGPRVGKPETRFHRQESPDGVLTWLVTVSKTVHGKTLYGRPSGFELDGNPLTTSEGRALKLRHKIID